MQGKVSKVAGIVLLQIVGVALVAAQQSQTAVPAAQGATIWSMPANQRQTLLADQIQQAQQTRRLTTDLSSQIQAAYASREQARQAAQQAAANEFAAQQRSSAAIQDASQAAFGAGFDNAARSAEAKAMPKRVDMVVSAAKDWTPPKQYTAASSKVVALDDPFSPSPAAGATSDPLALMRNALQGTCLLLDDEHGVAQVENDCVVSGQRLPFQIGDYPVLVDGNLLDSPERVKTFLVNCADRTSPLYTLRNDSEMVILKR